LGMSHSPHLPGSHCHLDDVGDRQENAFHG
jgi:hypothetical protein